MKISTAYISDIGGREYNDDTAKIFSIGKGICAFIGDGLGGYAGGKIASEAAAQAIEVCGKRGRFLEESTMQEAAALAEMAVQKEQKERHGKMKTTMVVLAIEGNQARWMHVGDSRLYHFTENKLKTQTMDHSVSQVAVLMGEIEQRDIRFHEDRNRVLRALGSDNAKPDISTVTELTGNGEAFLLCTDGFWEYVYENEMEAFLAVSKDPKEWLDKMKELIVKRAPKDQDNFSAAAVFCRQD